MLAPDICRQNAHKVVREIKCAYYYSAICLQYFLSTPALQAFAETQG